MSNLLLNTYVNQNLLTELKEYLNDATIDISSDDIYEAITLTETTRNMAIRQALIEYLIKKGESVDLSTDSIITDDPHFIEHQQLIMHLFRYALEIGKLDTARELLTQCHDKHVLLNQTHESHLPLVQELFNKNNINGVRFLIENGAQISEALINAIANQRRHPVVPLLELIEQHNKTLRPRLLPHLFRHEILNNNFSKAEQYLSSDQDDGQNDKLLNQVNAHQTPFVQELFSIGSIPAVNFLIEKGASVNKKDARGNTLVSRIAESENNHLALLDNAAKAKGDFTGALEKNPLFIFTAVHYAQQHPFLLTMVLKAAPDLLVRENNRTIFETVIANNDTETLQRLLMHVNDIVIQREQILRYLENPADISMSQLVNCSFILDHCYPHLIAYNKNNAQMSNEYLFKQGMLRFLPLYYPFQACDLPDPIVFEEFKQKIIDQLKLLEMPKNDILRLAKTDLYKFHGGVNAIQLKYLMNDADEHYVKTVRNPALAAERRKAEERAQQAKQTRLRQEDQRRRVEADRLQAITDHDKDLLGIFNELLATMTELASYMKTRAYRKFWLDAIDSLASLVIFVTVNTYSILAVINYKDEAKDHFPNATKAGISLGVYFAEFIVHGILNGFFATNLNDMNDRTLRFHQLPQSVQDKITRIMSELNPLGLAVTIDPNCEVEYLITNIFDTLNHCSSRLQQVKTQFPAEEINIAPFLMPKLTRTIWKIHYGEKLESAALVWGVLLFVQGFMSVLQYNTNPDDYDPLGYAYVVSLSSFPTYLLGIILGEVSRNLTVLAREKISHMGVGVHHAYQRAIQNDNTRHIEMDRINLNVVVDDDIEQGDRSTEGAGMGSPTMVTLPN